MCNGNREILKQAYSSFERQLNSTIFPSFEEAVVELSLLFEEKKIQFQEGIKGRFSCSISNRFIHECFGCIACLRGGVFSATYHHIRDLLETVAIFHYVFKHQTSKSKWFERYVEFTDVFRYNYEKDLDPSKRIIPKSEFDSLQSKESYWLQLYNPKPKTTNEIRKWTKKIDY